MNKKRKNYSPEEKVSILKEHLVNGVPVSELCDRRQLHPTVFYRWQRQLFEQGAAAFQSDQKREVSQLKQKIEKLENKMVKKNEVLGELMEEHIALKKSLGEE
ncbi:MAG: transposase [Methanosarcinaceae archaeon]